ncbi:MAG: hypothetical protein J6U23_13945 [Clostridiales bacterium]|nr:hypothetical protein [Clostridiales bacterium]
MKATKIASLLLTASIAFTASACTIEIKDQGNTVDKVIQAVADKGIDVKVNDQQIGTVATTTSNSSSTKKIQLGNNVPSSTEAVTETTEQTADTSAIVFDINDKKDLTTETSATSTEITEATTTTETTAAVTEAPVVTEAPKATEEVKKPAETTPEVTPEPTAEVKKTTELPDDCVIDFINYNYTSKWTLDCDMGSFSFENGDGCVVATYDGKVSELPISYNDYLGVVTANTYMIRVNGNTFFWVISSVSPDNHGLRHDLNVYKFENEQFIYYGSIEGLSRIHFGNTSRFTAVECFDEAASINVVREYCVGTDGMPQPLTNYREFDSLTNMVTFNGGFSGFIYEDGEKTNNIFVGFEDDYVFLKATDGETYLDVETVNGYTVRIGMTGIYSQFDHNDPFYVHNAILACVKDSIFYVDYFNAVG